MLDIKEKREKATTQRAKLKAKKEKAQQDAYKKQCQDYLDQGLTRQGFTKKFEGQSVIFYLNNIEIKCTIDYDMAVPHLEFYSVKDREPSVLTETGYRSHFTQVNLKDFESMEKVIESCVKSIMSEDRKKGKKYILSWEPSEEYLRDNPVQLSLFGKMMKEARC